MNGAIHLGGVWVGRGWDLKDLPDFVKALHCSCSVCLRALAKPLPWHGGTCKASSLAHGCSLTAPLIITMSAFLYNLIPADFAFFADILPDLLASGLLSLTPSLDLQAQGSTPTHWKSLAPVFPKHWSSSDPFEHRFLSLTSPFLSTKHIYPLALASPCPLETSNPLMSITFFVTLSILSLMSALSSDLSHCFPPLQSSLHPQLFLHCLLRKYAPWTHSAQRHDNSYHHIVLVIFPICFASSSLYIYWPPLKFRKHFPWTVLSTISPPGPFLKSPCALLQVMFRTENVHCSSNIFVSFILPSPLLFVNYFNVFLHIWVNVFVL